MPLRALLTGATPPVARIVRIPAEARRVVVGPLVRPGGPVHTFTHDPSAVLDYTWDWSDWLGSDVITSHSVTADEAADVTLDTSSATDTTVVVWVSGGIAGESDRLTCQIDTAAGRRDARTITLQVRRR